jgi:hypothetical protein
MLAIIPLAVTTKWSLFYRTTVAYLCECCRTYRILFQVSLFNTYPKIYGIPSQNTVTLFECKFVIPGTLTYLLSICSHVLFWHSDTNLIQSTPKLLGLKSADLTICVCLYTCRRWSVLRSAAGTRNKTHGELWYGWCTVTMMSETPAMIHVRLQSACHWSTTDLAEAI